MLYRIPSVQRYFYVRLIEMFALKVTPFYKDLGQHQSAPKTNVCFTPHVRFRKTLLYYYTLFRVIVCSCWIVFILLNTLFCCGSVEGALPGNLKLLKPPPTSVGRPTTSLAVPSAFRSMLDASEWESPWTWTSLT